MTPEARQELIQRQLEAREVTGGETETYRLEIRGEPKLLPVISLPVDAVLLNPNSHRIQAELESHPNRELIEGAPHSDEAQEAIEELLRNTEYFDDLRRDLKETSQRQPGVVTRFGLMVNANRRTVALRDSEMDSVRVAVLPPGLNERDIDAIELQLQMRRDYFAEYTFTNRLKFIETWRSRHGMSDEWLARVLGFAASSEQRELKKGADEVRLEARLFTMIRDVQEMSGRTIPLTFFNDKRQTLLEVDLRYEKAKKHNPKAALALRNAQLITLFLRGTRYQMVRKMDEAFFSDYFVPALEESSGLSDVVEALTRRYKGDETSGDDLGLSVLGGEDEPTDEPDPQVLLTLLSRTAGEDVISLSDRDGDEVQFSRERLVEELDVAMGDALEELQADTSRENRLETPIARVRDAERKLKKARHAWDTIKTNPRFDIRKFEMHVGKTARTARALHEEVKRHLENGSRGND